MAEIGGNTTLTLFKKNSNSVNAIGEKIANKSEYKQIWGYLDLSSGSSYYQNFNAKVQESSHIFICDYEEIKEKATNLVAECNGNEYDVLLIDDPMGLHEHLEIFLKYIGE